MPMTLSDEIKRILDAPNFAHLATLMADGSPKNEPVWIAREGDRILITTDRKSIKSINIERDPRVALSITDYADPYDQVLIRGRVIETRGDEDLAFMDSLSRKYTGVPFPRRRWSGRMVYVIEPTLARHYKLQLKHTPPA
jgi:PPOX class probable F420-dependent enzyme